MLPGNLNRGEKSDKGLISLKTPHKRSECNNISRDCRVPEMNVRKLNLHIQSVRKNMNSQLPHFQDCLNHVQYFHQDFPQNHV